jgi:hypothetical protein
MQKRLMHNVLANFAVFTAKLLETEQYTRKHEIRNSSQGAVITAPFAWHVHAQHATDLAG